MKKIIYTFLFSASLVTFSGTLSSRSSSATGFEDVGSLVEQWYRYSPATVLNDGAVLYHQKAQPSGFYELNRVNNDNSQVSSLLNPFKVFEAVSFSNELGDLNVFSVEDINSAGVVDRNGPEQKLGFFTTGHSVQTLSFGSFDINQARDLYLNGNQQHVYLVFAASKVGTDNSSLYYLRFEFNESEWAASSDGLQKVDFGSANATRIEPRITQDGTFIYYRQGSSLFQYDVTKKSHTLIKSGIKRFDISADGKVLYYVVGDDLYKVSIGKDISGIARREVNIIADFVGNTFYDSANFNFGRNISCSADGRYVAFISDKFLADATSALGSSVAYLFDSYSRTIICLSKEGAESTFNSVNVAISANAQFVTFAAKPNFLATNYSVYRYALSADQLLTERLFSGLEISETHKMSTTQDNCKVFLVTKQGVRYDPTLIDSLTGGKHILKIGPGTDNYSYRFAAQGGALLERDTSRLTYYPVNSDYTLGDEDVVSNSLTRQFGISADGKTVFFIQGDDLWKWSADTKSSESLSGSVSDIDDLSSIAVSANGNFVACKKRSGGLVVFAKDSSGDWKAYEPSALSAVTAFSNASVSRNGRILAFDNGSAVKVFDFFNDSFVANDGLTGGTNPFVSASGAEVTFVKANTLKSLRVSNNSARDIETESGSYGLSNVVPNGNSITFLANADGLNGRDGKLDLYQYYFERSNTAPASVSSSPTQLKVDTLHRLDMNVAVSDDYDMDLDIQSITAPLNGSFNYKQLFNGKSTYQSERGFTGVDKALLKVVDSSGLVSDVAVNIDVLKSTLNFADGYIPDDPTSDGYDVALALNSAGLASTLDLRDGDAPVSFSDPVYSDLRLSDDGSQIIIENVTALGYENVSFQVDGVSQTVRLEYGRDFIMRTGWNMLGVPYEFTEAGFVALEQDLEAGWAWDGDSYASCIDEQTDRLKNIENGAAYWLFHILGEDQKTVTLAPNKPAGSVRDLNDSEEDDFFNVSVFDNKWRMISPIGYGENATRRVSGTPVWGWDSEDNVYSLPENSGGWKMNALNGYWQFGHDGFKSSEVTNGKVTLKYDLSAE